MRCLEQLPEPPLFHIEVEGPRDDAAPGFLRYVSRAVRTKSGAGELSAAFVYDEVDRRCLDAVVVVPHFLPHPTHDPRDPYVVLRSAIRPPVALRKQSRSPIPEPENRGLWEFPAGLVEEEEQSTAGLFEAARRELAEETGFLLAPDELHELGSSAFPAPGVIAERQFYFHARVDPAQRTEPSLDGSPLEEAGELVAVPLSAALLAAREGRLGDAKTELCLWRLLQLLGEGLR